MGPNVAKYLIHTLKTIQTNGIVAGVKMAAVLFQQRSVHIRFKGIAHPVYLRKGTSDPLVAFSTFVEKEYRTPDKNSLEVIFDLGANVGYSAVYFAHHYPDAQIICLEPDSENFECFIQNTRDYPNIVAINQGVWWRRANLQVVDSTEEAWGYQFTEASDEGCPSSAIDELIEEHGSGKQTMVKMDIEGAEKEIFQHTSAWIQNTKWLQLEIHDCWKIVFDRLQEFDYKARISGENVVIELAPNR